MADQMTKVLRLARAKMALAWAQLEVDGFQLGQDGVERNQMLRQIVGIEQGIVQVLRDAGLWSANLLSQGLVHDHLVRARRSCQPKRHTQKLEQSPVREEGSLLDVVGV